MVERPSLDWEVVGSIPRSGKEILSKNQKFLLRSKEMKSLSQQQKSLVTGSFQSIQVLIWQKSADSEKLPAELAYDW